MAIKLTETNDGKCLEVQVTGKLLHEDYRQLVPRFEQMVRRHGRIRVLLDMADFHGWEAAALWDDIKFDLRHFASIERLAMAGERRWQKGMSVFCRPFTAASIRYFDRAAIQTARAWLAEKADSSHAAPASILRVFQSKDQTRAFYNKISRVYDLLADRSEGPVRRAGLELLKARPGERVLEIGFGTGHTLVQLAQAVGPEGRVFGLDLSDKMLKRAKGNLAEAGLVDRVRLRCGDAARLPFREGSLDAVFMSFTLELFDTPEIPVVLRECRRVLRPGGRLVVVGMSKEGQSEPLIGVFEWTHKHFPNFLDCRPIYVRVAVEKAGFRIIKALKRHLWIPVEAIMGMKEQ